MSVTRRADRADLVRYAGASLDFNPIHWDGDAARAAGLDDCVVHGMLIMAWAATAASEEADENQPLRRLKIRFKSPLYAGLDANVQVNTGEPGSASVSITGADGTTIATARADYGEGA